MSKKGRDFILFIEDIIDSVEKIERYVKGLSYEEFKNNDMVIDAVIRNFEIIGEATANIPEDVQEKYSEVEWREAKGFRNVLIHAYFGIDVEAVWDTIEKDIPGFKKHVVEVLEREKKRI